MKHIRLIIVTAMTPVLLMSTCAGARQTSYRLSDMNLTFRVLDKVRSRYVNPARIVPRKMLIEALNYIQRQVPEIIVRQKNSTVEVQVDDQSRSFDIAHVSSPWSLTKTMGHIFGFIQAHIHKTTDPKKVEFATIDGILSTLDPHTVLMRQDFFREMAVDTAGQFGGLGIEISICDGLLTIRRPIRDTPAWHTQMKYGKKIYRIRPAGQRTYVYKKGKHWTHRRADPGDPGLRMTGRDQIVQLRPGDHIVRIENESTINMTLSQSVQRLRGKPRTDVLIWILRKGWRRPKPFLIQRAVIHVPSVREHLLKGNIGYVRVYKFQATTARELRSALVRLGLHKLKGVIMDLRDNHGGLLDQAAGVVNTFVQSGTILTTVSSDRPDAREIRARPFAAMLPKVPLALLVNQESASAAEIVAAGLKQLNRAVIVGRNTFGKGSVQIIFPMPNKTGLKLTVSQWRAPGNMSVQRIGLVPDVKILPVDIRTGKPFSFYATGRRYRKEGDLKSPLASHPTNVQVHPFQTIYYLKHPIPPFARSYPCHFCGQPKNLELPADPSVFYQDFQVDMTRRLLTRAGRPRRLATLAAAKAFFERVKKNQDAAIVAKFKTQGIDWSAAPSNLHRRDVPRYLRVTLSAPHQGHVVAGSPLIITANARNEGKVPLYRVRAILKSSNPFLAGREFFFGLIPPGQSRTARVKINTPMGLTTQKDWLKLNIFPKTTGATKRIFITIAARPAPRFSYSYHIAEGPSSNHDGLIQKGENLRIHLEIRNSGKGTARQAYATLSNESARALFVKKGRVLLAGLKPGRVVQADFLLKAQQVPAHQRLARVRVRVYACGTGRYVSDELAFRIWPTKTSVEKKVGIATVVGQHGVTIRACPDLQCSPIAWMGLRGRMRATGVLNGWERVRVGSLWGFVPLRGIRITRTGRARPSKPSMINRVLPPTVSVANPVMLVKQGQIHLRGAATDALGVEDLFIRVSNSKAKIYERKVFYASNRRAHNRTTLAFSAVVPVWPGKNVVEVVARQNDRVMETKTLVVLRQ
ncbi:MAG: hypothetical protein J7M25_06425 [Deltaproteobacteria bacterium]|nr:hypothetical protein [Deltaproteobacteria bacterium]